MEYRLATEADVSGVGRGCLDMYHQSPWVTMDLSHSIPLMTKLLTDRLKFDPSWGLYVADDDGVIVGFIGIELVTHPLHPGFPFVREWALWVHPRYRGKKVAWELKERAKQWGRMRKAKGLLYAKSLTKTRPKRGPVETHIWEELGD